MPQRFGKDRRDVPLAIVTMPELIPLPMPKPRGTRFKAGEPLIDDDFRLCATDHAKLELLIAYVCHRAVLLGV
jgi:hypothetical protein